MVKSCLNSKWLINLVTEQLSQPNIEIIERKNISYKHLGRRGPHPTNHGWIGWEMNFISHVKKLYYFRDFSFISQNSKVVKRRWIIAVTQWSQIALLLVSFTFFRKCDISVCSPGLISSIWYFLDNRNNCRDHTEVYKHHEI